MPVRIGLTIMVLMLSTGIASSQLPPLIDRELFFGDPEISRGQISPDGAFISFVKPFKNVRNIWIKKTGEPFEAARPLTADTTRPVTQYFWSRDSKVILYSQDKGGDENFRIYSVDPSATGNPVPPSRDLTPMEKVRARIIDVPRGTPGEIIVGLNDRKAELHDVYRLNIHTGERTLIRKNEDNVAGWMTDLKGRLRLGLRVSQTGGTEILRIDGDSLVAIYDVTAEESTAPLRFTPDGEKFYLMTNKSAAVDKAQLQLFDLKTGTTTLVDRDPDDAVDLGDALFSEVSDELLATVYVGDRDRVYPKQAAFAADYAKLRAALPDGELEILSRTADESIWVVSASSDVDPGSVHVFDRRTGTAGLLYRLRPNLSSADLAPMKPVTYTARDGMRIPAYLVTPKNVPAKNLPTVLVVHGGPWSRDTWGYNAEAQFLANRGYAVLLPNFRGSVGYGKKFINAGNKEWGTGAMQHDLTDGAKYLISEGIADPRKIAIYGGSYGGYATLAGLAFTPDVYAAGISYVGPSNILTLLSSIPPYWAPIKKIFAVRVGDLENPDDVKRLTAQSPLNSARSIAAPLLVIQGANDPRVKKAESDQIVVAMRDLGRKVEYMVAADEGHGFAGRENRLAVYATMERFFSKHLGGRYQESVPAEVQKRIDALTVDIATVTMPAGPASAVPPAAAFTGSLLKAGTASYSSTMSARGQSLKLTTTRSLQKASLNGAPVWRIVEVSTSPMGEATDTLDMDATTLLPLRRSMKQGAMTIGLAFEAGAINGKIAGPMNMPINVKKSGAVLSDGIGVELPLSTAPLAAGYAAGVKVFDIMGGRVKDMVARVTGDEKVTTPAGTFDAHVVEVRPAEGGNEGVKIWIAKEGRAIVKSETNLPAAMGGGSVVSELAK
jgi:dipeptidyl aminopeptidase/acylaminoacyl peptidase